VQSIKVFPFGVRFANAFVSYILYIGKMIWPCNLAVFYPHPGWWPLWQVLGAVLLLIAVTIMVIQGAKRFPYLLVGWLWYVGTLVPVIGLVQVGGQGIADRYTYVPLIGLFIMIAWSVLDILGGRRHRRVVLSISVGLLLLLMMIGTKLQVKNWQNGVTLFGHSLDVTSDNFFIHDCLGSTLAGQGKIQDAMVHYAEALRIQPNYAQAHSNLGTLFIKQEKYQEAIDQYKEALRINPKIAPAANNLAYLYSERGENLDEALTLAKSAKEQFPDDPNFSDTLGWIYYKKNIFTQAIAYLKEANEKIAGNPTVRYHLGMAYFKNGNEEDAKRELKEALELDQKFPGAEEAKEVLKGLGLLRGAGN
jgi:Flp pilus assembly protein TadD